MPQIKFDFRSDTVTKPSAAMRAAMAEAEVGDDVMGDDPSVRRLEAMLAEQAGKEAGLFFPSGTQSNLAAIMAHCGRGDEYIVGQQAHTYRWEQGGAAVLGSVQPQPLPHQSDGSLLLSDIADAIKPDDIHFARSRLLALENTVGGQVLSLDYMAAATELARDRGLDCHLDGARAFNAAIALGVPLAAVTAPFDTVSICLSKGLGAPVGSVLVGDKARILAARRIRKALGGGMRQAGVIAAGGIYALEHNVARLADDHALAQRLAAGLAVYPALKIVPVPQTNIVFVDIDEPVRADFTRHLVEAGVGFAALYGGKRHRWVTHLDVDQETVDGALAVVERFFARR